MIADDQGLIQLQLTRMLHRQGMTVVGVASDGNEAVQVVLSTAPDLVLMDISMPVLNGLEATRRILAQQPVCIVMLTAYSDELYRQQALEIGAAGYLVKPILPPLLQRELQFALSQWQARGI